MGIHSDVGLHWIFNTGPPLAFFLLQSRSRSLAKTQCLKQQLSSNFYDSSFSFSALFGGRKGIRPVKTEWLPWWGAGVVICLGRCADLHRPMAQLMPRLLTVSCFSKIQTGFTFRVPAHPGSPGQKAVKLVLFLFYNS